MCQVNLSPTTLFYGSDAGEGGSSDFYRVPADTGSRGGQNID